MKKQLIRMSIAILSIWSFAANADPIVYEIESYTSGNFSASWLHHASNCGSNGPDSGIPLCMSGGGLQSIFGTIEGNLAAGILSITGGELTIGGNAHLVLGGALGAFGSAPAWPNAWHIEIASLGTFYFEDIAMSSGPNFFDGQQLILWGQNMAAYDCAINKCTDHRPWGIDLYGSAVSVPEPGTLALFGIGLIGMGLARRKAA